MTRRRSGADPTSRRGMPVEDALAELARILATLNPRERGVLVLRFGLRDATPRTWTEIGQVYGVTRERVRQIEHEAMARLQETAVPYEWLLDEMPLIPAEVRCRVLDLDPPDPLPPLVHCPRHRSYWAPGVLDHLHPREQCGNCPCLVLWGAGRPRKYCSNACKQAAYRRRTAESNARVAGRAGRSG